jgi:ribosomal protein L9
MDIIIEKLVQFVDNAIYISKVHENAPLYQEEFGSNYFKGQRVAYEAIKGYINKPVESRITQRATAFSKPYPITTQKTYNEIQEQIEKLEKMLVALDEQIKQVGRYSAIGINMGKQYEQIENDIKTLRWVLS